MDLSAVTLTQLRYLVTVDRYRSFRAAAERCHVTQPALSMQIHKLEELLGVPVFDRSCQPIVPTERGAAVLEQARAVLRECDRLGDIVHGGAELSGRYRLGVLPTLAPTLVPMLLPPFAAAYPRVELLVEEVQTEAMIRRLADGTLDGGLAVTPLSAGLRERALCHEPFYVYLPPKHHLCQSERVRQSDLYDERPWILAEGHCFRNQVLHLCKVDRSAMSPRLESGSFETLIRLVDAGLGLTVLPEMVVDALPAATRRARVRPFVPPVPVRQVSFVVAREHLHQGVASALCATLLDGLPPHLLGGADDAAVLSPLPR